MALKFNLRAHCETVVQRCLAVEMNLDILFEDIFANVAAANLGRAAEILGEDDAGRALVAAADLQLDAVGRRRLTNDQPESNQHRRVQ